MPPRRLSRDEIGERGSLIYQTKLVAQFDSSAYGKFMAIDVETEEYEVADESVDAADRLWERCPDAQVYIERVGYVAAFHAYGSRRSVSSP